MLPFRRLLALAIHTPKLPTLRHLSTTPTLHAKPLPPRPTILEDDITEAFLKGTGPGGQKINKTSSAVQLKHLPTGIVIKCQETRSRSQNRKIARRILADKVEDLLLGEDSRTALKADREKRKKASKNKKSNRKYRKLAEGKEGEEEVDEGEDGGVKGEEHVVTTKGDQTEIQNDAKTTTPSTSTPDQPSQTHLDPNTRQTS